MSFTRIRQTMTDDACDIVSALSRARSMPLQDIAGFCAKSEYATRFILEQMALAGVTSESWGNWSLTAGFRASAF